MGKPLVSRHKNGVVVASCSELASEEMIQRIIGTDILPESFSVTSNVAGYPCHIETKYYSADLNLFAFRTKDLVSADFAESIEAVLIHFDSERVETFKEAQSWLPFIEQFSPPVQLLACNNCNHSTNSGVSRNDILSWCLKNKFELVELNPDQDSDEEEDDFKETKGYKRIVQALHAHTWSEISLKDPPVYQPSLHVLNSMREQQTNSEDIAINEDLLQQFNEVVGGNQTENKVTDSAETQENEASSTNRDGVVESSMPQELLLEAVAKEPVTDSFEQLFSQLRSMKEKAETLSGDERKKYAAKIAIEFWRATGGDEEEIAGISSSDDD